MKVRLEYLKDIAGNNYVGVNIYSDIVYKYLNQLEEILGDEYEVYTTNQKNRDHGKHHITVINLMEYNERVKTIGVDKFVNHLEKQFHTEFDVQLMGLGSAEAKGNRTYFVVVRSNDLNEFRKSIGLGEYDFHITLGFKWKDVFGVRKNVVLEMHDPFLKLLKLEYYKNNENFNFVKTLLNFDGDINSEVDVIKIEKSHATFRIGEYRYFTVSLINDSLMITAKWEDQQDRPALSNTIIYRKIKDV